MSDKETIENLHNLLRALVWKFGRDVTLTKEEFMQSLGLPLSIQHQEDVTYLRIWYKPERGTTNVNTEGSRRA